MRIVKLSLISCTLGENGNITVVFFGKSHRLYLAIMYIILSHAILLIHWHYGVLL